MSRPSLRLVRPIAIATVSAALLAPASGLASSSWAAAPTGVAGATIGDGDAATSPAAAAETRRSREGRSAIDGQRTVRATSAWVAHPEGDRVEATAYAVVENGTMYDVYVVAAETDAAAAAELRAMQESGASARVAEVPIPAFGQLEMSPKGVHIVLTGLKTPLKTGDTVTLVLALDSGERLSVAAPVK